MERAPANAHTVQAVLETPPVDSSSDAADEFIGIFYIVADTAGSLDGVSETDGIDVTSRPLGPQFPRGLLVVQYSLNLDPSEHQDFKYVSWQAIVDELELFG